MHREPVYQLTVYEADDTTILFTVSTDPAHANPYLKAPTSFPEQEIDFAKGSASIGQCTVQIVDVPTDPTDQDTGYLTGLLADANGNSQINGHRALLTEDFGSGAEVVLDGVVRTVTLLDTFVTYDLELRDIRERERRTKAFARTDTPTILPRGVLNGYGVTVATGPFFGGSITFPIPPTEPLVATYRADTANRGRIEFPFAAPSPNNTTELELTDPMRDALESVGPVSGSPSLLVHDRWKLLWRDEATGGAYTVVEQIAHRHPSLPGGGGQQPFDSFDALGSIVFDRDYISRIRVNNLVSGDTLPSDAQVIEVIVQYDGPVSEAWPLHLRGLTVGELLRNGYRGDYSEDDPRIRYDEAALLALATPVRTIIEKPVDDFRVWAEEQAYPIAHAAPTLNAAGEISPVTYVLPDASVTLVALDDDNCRPAGGGWSHGTADAINLVRVTYKRDYRISEDQRTNLALSDQILSREIEHRFPLQASIDLLGEQELRVSSDLLRAIGTSDSGPVSGDVSDEAGAQVANRIARMATDRFALGGQYFALEASRTDADAEGLKVGTWVAVGVSWMPDYLSGERGLSRLAQVVGRKNLNAAWAALTLIDAGSANAPLFAPTLGTVTTDLDGVVEIPVTVLGSGDPDARVDYAVAIVEPADDSGAWNFLDRVDAPSTLTTPPLAPGGTAWVRARSEDVGRRPSAYTTAVSIAIPSTPRVLDVSVEIDDAGEPAVRWTPSAFCVGVRIYYEVHEPSDEPTFGASEDFDAADLEAVLTGVTVPQARILSVQVEPYPAFGGGSVSGTPGPVVERRLLRKDRTVTIRQVLPRLSTAGTLSVQVLAEAGARSVKVAAAAGSDPSRATIEGETEVVVGADGVADVTGLGGFSASDDIRIGVIVYRTEDASDVGSEVSYLRTTGTAIRSGNTDSVDNAAAGQVARLAQGETVAGAFDGNGEKDIVFTESYDSAPLIIPLGFGLQTYEADDAASDQTLELSFLDVTTDGATIRALLKTGTTTTPDGDDFPAGNSLDAVAETTECNLASLPAGGAEGDAYTIHYSFDLQITEQVGGSYQVTVTLAFDSNDGGGWVERATRTFQLTAEASATESTSLAHVLQNISVSGLATNDDIRIRVKSISESGSGTIDDINVHGFNLATDGDPAEGVTWLENTGGSSQNAAPTAAHYVTYQALEIAG
jgi:hypothetical protein